MTTETPGIEQKNLLVRLLKNITQLLRWKDRAG